MPRDEDNKDNAALIAAVEGSTLAAQAATDAVKGAILALPNLLAQALNQNNAGAGAAAQGQVVQAAAAGPTTGSRNSDFWDHDPRAFS